MKIIAIALFSVALIAAVPLPSTVPGYPILWIFSSPKRHIGTPRPSAKPTPTATPITVASPTPTCSPTPTSGEQVK